MAWWESGWAQEIKNMMVGGPAVEKLKEGMQGPTNPLLDVEAYKQASGWQPAKTASGMYEAQLANRNRASMDFRGAQAQFRGAAQAPGGAWQNTFTNLREGQAAAAGARQGPQIGQMAWQDRGAQDALTMQLQAQAAGTAPSAAQMQLQQGGEQAMRQAMSLAASQRGRGGAAAQRAGMQAGQASMLQANQQAAQMRAAEQAAGQQALGQHLAGMRGQEIGLATTGAQMQQQQQAQNDAMVMNLMRQGLSEDQARAQVEQASQQMNLQAQMQQAQLNDQMTQYYMSQGLTRDLAEQQAMLEIEKMKQAQAQQIMMGQANMQAGALQQQMAREGALLGAGGGLLSALITKK